jgi:hypothetical protein
VGSRLSWLRLAMASINSLGGRPEFPACLTIIVNPLVDGRDGAPGVSNLRRSCGPANRASQGERKGRRTTRVAL